MIRVTKSISIEINIPLEDARKLFSDLTTKDATPSQITCDFLECLANNI
jgi:hypothetical protein